MSVIKGLQDLLIKMGGTPESGDNSDELVRKIAKAYDPSSQELPAVGEQRDKFLHINAETGAIEWDGVNIPESDEQILIPIYTKESSSYYPDPSAVSCDTAFGDILDAVKNGKCVQAVLYDAGSGSEYGSGTTLDLESFTYFEYDSPSILFTKIDVHRNIDYDSGQMQIVIEVTHISHTSVGSSYYTELIDVTPSSSSTSGLYCPQFYIDGSGQVSTTASYDDIYGQIQANGFIPGAMVTIDNTKNIFLPLRSVNYDGGAPVIVFSTTVADASSPDGTNVYYWFKEYSITCEYSDIFSWFETNLVPLLNNL